MKEYNDSILKFKITKDKLKMEMSLNDLIWLFENDPYNMAESGDSAAVEVKRGKKQEFAEKVVMYLLDDAPHEQDCLVWGMPFEYVFSQLLDGYEPEILKYIEEDFGDDE